MRRSPSPGGLQRGHNHHGWRNQPVYQNSVKGEGCTGSRRVKFGCRCNGWSLTRFFKVCSVSGEAPTCLRLVVANDNRFYAPKGKKHSVLGEGTVESTATVAKVLLIFIVVNGVTECFINPRLIRWVVTSKCDQSQMYK